MTLRLRALTAAACAFALAGCGTGSPETEPDSPGSGTSASSAPAEDEAPLAGALIAVDPGHNGGNAKSWSKISKQVDDGRGGTKPCNTTGTATADDFPEHRFNWEVAQKLKKDLEERGAEVVMSRSDDTGVGPCVDERGQFADDADVLISIHANGSESSEPYGFGAIIAPDRTPEESRKLASSVVAGLKDARLKPNPSYGKKSIAERKDLGGLNHASVPAVLIELGEMRNPDEAKLMKSAKGQQRYADGLADGLADYLEGRAEKTR